MYQPHPTKYRLLMVPALMIVVLTCMLTPTIQAQDTDDQDQNITLNLSNNMELKVLVDYVSNALKINIVYDETLNNKRLTLKTPQAFPKSALLDLLRSSLRMKGLNLSETNTPGFYNITAAKSLESIAAIDAKRANNNVITRVIPLKHSNAQRAAQMIKPFLTQPGGNAVALQDNNLIIVTDYSDQIERINGLIARLDIPGPETKIAFLSVQHAEASKLAPQVSQLLQARRRAQSGNNNPAQVTVNHDARTNQIILIGQDDDLKMGKEIIASLDKPLAQSTKTYQFTSASPKKVDQLVRQLLGPTDINRLYRSAVDEDSNILVVTTITDIHVQIVSLKEQIDRPVTESQNPVRFYKLENAKATEVIKTIREIEGDNGLADIALDAHTNPSTADTPERTPITRTDPNTRNINPNNNNPGTPGNTTQSTPNPIALRTGNARITADPNTNTIIVIAPPNVQETYARLIKNLDKRRPQVLIECTIVTLDTSDGFNLRVDISNSSQIDNTRILNFSSSGLSLPNPDSGALALPVTIPIGYTGAVLSLEDTYVVLNALKTHGRSKVIASPRILVNDNASGKLVSAAEQPVSTTTIGSTTDTSGFGGFVAAGTTINVTPQISEGDHLNLDYSFELSSFGSSESSGNGLPAPRQSNTVESQVTIPDGYTIVIGGLKRQDESLSKDRIPGLGEIPLIEYLFGKTTEAESESTLFIFVRATILRDQDFNDLKYISVESMEKAGLPNDMPQSEPVWMK